MLTVSLQFELRIVHEENVALVSSVNECSSRVKKLGKEINEKELN